MKQFFIFYIFFCVGLCQAQTFEVSGVIFLDENGNGLKDPFEEPLRNVRVSNGKTLTSSNRKGNYTIEAEPGDKVFPILSQGYSFNKGKTWWFSVSSQTQDFSKRIKGADFGLITSPLKANFKALIIGDIQVGDHEELWYADQSILSELRQRDDYDFSIFLGDLVNDEPQLFKPLSQRIKNLQKPTWSVYGNHDKNSIHSHKFQHKDYSEFFGPTTYAFYKEKVLFVVLNTIEPVGKYGYNGKYGANDLQFLSELLKETGENQLLVISQHIPLGMLDNKSELLEIVKKQERVLLLSGHTHTVFQNFRNRGEGQQFHELTAGAVSGHWWTGEKDWQGVPLALMQCGTPRGYFEVDFSQNKDGIDYQIKFKGVGLTKEKQASIWLGDPGLEVKNVITPKDSQFFVNVFAGSEKTQVQYRINDGDWKIMERERIIDPFIRRIKELQDEKKYPDSISRRSPYLSRSSSHIWKSTIPTDLQEGYHKLEIRANDHYGLDHQEVKWFWMKRE